MARPREDVFTRVARHCGHTRESLIRFIDEGQASCLAWTGQMKPPRPTARKNPTPYLKKIGHPVRILFARMMGLTEELDRFVWLRNKCTTYGCINPRHYKVVRAMDFRNNRQAFCPLTREEEFEDNVLGLLQMLKEGEDLNDLGEFSSPRELNEAVRRFSLGG